MYCSPNWHNGNSKHHNLSKLQQAWDKIYQQTHHHKLPYKISFTGGELTGNKNFLPFVAWLRDNYGSQLFQLLVTTNGSATYKYYRSMFDYVDNITFSVHSEHIDEQKFFSTVIKLRKTINPKKFIHVAIMKEHWNLDRIPAYERICKQNNISYSVNAIDYSCQTRSIPIMKGKLNLEI
jgi:molybdenum cofactor biosynthesis enzyme MoaA